MNVTNARFLAEIALGIRGIPDADHTTWEIVSFKGGHGTIAPKEGGVLDNEASPEDAYDVLLSLAADKATWAAAEAGGRDVLVALMGQKKFDVKAEGQAAFFVRHLESILEAADAYAAELASRP